ncbi:MAG TPA: branched-chain amino acid ABC transporter ATP-binding protein/permease [Streptosporangiaceae bacterium]|nr:branched-chain amino acid ABC transporter ATP-binding protein/permease [Streptosporangiaceae bacterium]
MNAYYLVNLLVYAAVDAMACLGLSQQFGIAGVTNFGFIIFQAAGGYTAAVLAMPADSANGGFQRYIGGWHLPFPVPWLGAAVVGGVLALPFTFLVGRRLRGDFAAVGLLVTAVLVNLLVTNYVPLFNGDAGISVIPLPLQSELNAQSQGYQWAFTTVAIALCAGVYLFVRRITESPYGRSLRAMRDNDAVADSLGKNLLSLRTGVMVTGGAIAGLSGGILVSYITTWSPAAWGYAETVVLFAAVIIGGAGNHRGAVLGAILVPVGFEEVTRFIPSSNSLPPNLIPSLEWVAIGLLIVVFLWVRPQGILPERKRVIALPAPPQPLPGGSTAGGGSAVAGPGGGASAAPAVRSAVRSAERAPRASDVQTADLPVGQVMLQAADLVREFGGVRAVDGVSLSVRRGSLTGLIGPNGAGKSTLLAMLAGTLPASSGTITYLGQDITGMPAFRRARIGLVRTFQLASEFKRLTVLENLLSAVPGHRGDSLRGAVRGRRYWSGDEQAAIDRAETILDRFGLREMANRYAGDLSGGQRRLVEIMRALMTEPTMLLLDEPMAGVHPNLARRIGDELVALCRDGMTILMVEHELAIMDEFCDPVIVMAEGAVLAEGTMRELRARSEVVEAYLVG